jgi:hypothetical protein
MSGALARTLQNQLPVQGIGISPPPFPLCDPIPRFLSCMLVAVVVALVFKWLRPCFRLHVLPLFVCSQDLIREGSNSVLLNSVLKETLQKSPQHIVFPFGQGRTFTLSLAARPRTTTILPECRSSRRKPFIQFNMKSLLTKKQVVTDWKRLYFEVQFSIRIRLQEMCYTPKCLNFPGYNIRTLVTCPLENTLNSFSFHSLLYFIFSHFCLLFYMRRQALVPGHTCPSSAPFSLHPPSRSVTCMCASSSAPFPSQYSVCTLCLVGASHGNLPHVGNTGDQVTLTQIAIQVTAG